MKLEPLFTVKENKMFCIKDNSEFDLNALHKIEIKWSQVELEPESYNEEFLAGLRDQLKVLDEKNEFAVLIPVVDKPLENAEQNEFFLNAFNHTARRVKDCVSVAGFELPVQLASADDFIDVLSVKHAQYIYFTKDKTIQNKSIVIY